MLCEICGREANATMTYGKVRNVAVCPVCDIKLFNTLSIDPVWLRYNKAFAILEALHNRYSSGSTDVTKTDVEFAVDTLHNMSVQLYNVIGQLVEELKNAN